MIVVGSYIYELRTWLHPETIRDPVSDAQINVDPLFREDGVL